MTGNDSDPNVEATYDSETDTYRAIYQLDGSGSLVGAVIHLVSVATGNEPETMDPLYDVVDTDALENLFRPREEETGKIEFRYCGCEVTALSNGEVVVSPLGRDE